MSIPAPDAQMNEPSPIHPEEMRGTITLKFGSLGSLEIKGRTTPAGLISAAIFFSALLIPAALIARHR